MIHTLFVVAALLGVAPVPADAVRCVQGSDQCAAVLDVGQVAPFSGVLLSSSLAAADLAARDRERMEAQALLNKTRRDCATNEQALAAGFASRLLEKDQKIAFQAKQIEELTPAFYEHPLFIVGAVLVTEALAAFAIASIAGAL